MPSKMRILYMTYANIPTKHAHGIHIMKMVESMNGHVPTSLVVPFFTHHNLYTKDVFSYYGIKSRFDIRRLYVPDFLYFASLFKSPFLASFLFNLHRLIFAFAGMVYALFIPGSVVYTRDIFVAFLLSFFKPVVYETHIFPRRMIFQRLLERLAHKRFLMWVCITHKMKHVYSLFKFDTKNLYVFHDSTDIADIACPSKHNRRPVIMYVGSLKSMNISKGLDYVLYAAQTLKDAQFVVVGIKTPQEMSYAKNMSSHLSNVEFVYSVPKHKVREYLCMADVLIIPYTFNEYLAYYTSPLKLFDYMATGKCIVASNLPVIREILDKHDAFFFNPLDKDDFVRKLVEAIKNRNLCLQKGKHAKSKLKLYTWDARAKHITNLIKQHLLQRHL